MFAGCNGEEILGREKLGMKGNVERREGNEEARLNETILVIKASGCGESGNVRAWVFEDQWLQDAGRRKQGSENKGGLEEPTRSQGSEWPFA